MAVAIRVDQGDWGGSRLSDIEAVARSAATSLDVVDDSESAAIVIQPTSGDDLPWTDSAPNASGEFVIHLNARRNLWARLAYQFAHEFCHVLADPRTWMGEKYRFAWIEEVLCETASLVALLAMTKDWAIEPPYPNWRDYSASLAAYEAERISDPARSLPPEVPFSTWLSIRLPLLEADFSRRDDYTIIAKEVLTIFGDRAAWRAIRGLHSWDQLSAASVTDFMNQWAGACAKEDRHIVEGVATILAMS